MKNYDNQSCRAHQIHCCHLGYVKKKIKSKRQLETENEFATKNKKILMSFWRETQPASKLRKWNFIKPEKWKTEKGF